MTDGAPVNFFTGFFGFVVQIWYVVVVSGNILQRKRFFNPEQLDGSYEKSFVAEFETQRKTAVCLG